MKEWLCLMAALVMILILAPACAGGQDAITFHEGWDVRDNNRVFYEIFVGSFSDSDRDGIGDLRGIINRMDYLNDWGSGLREEPGHRGNLADADL